MKQKDLMFYIRLVHLALEREKNTYFEKMNITSSQGDILLFLEGARQHGLQINQKSIEQHFQLSNPTITGLLNRMEEKKFIKRIKSSSDGRTKLILLTQESEAVLDHFQQHTKFIKSKLCTGLSEKEQLRILDDLKKMLTNLQDENLTHHS